MFTLTLALSLLIPLQQKQIQPKQVQIQPQHKGEVRQVRTQELRKFDKPFDRPRFPRPEDNLNRLQQWRWHPSYGWIGFPLDYRLPANDVLPTTFALPAEVQFYDVKATQTIVCPHCGQSFEVEIR